MMELKLGYVSDYYIHMGIMAVKLEEKLALGDIIRIRGQKTNIVQTVDSIQLEYLSIRSARPGERVGIKAEARVHPGDTVYKLIP